MVIYTPIESSRRVDRKYAVLKNIWSDFRPKKSKNRVKICIFKGLFKKSFFWHQNSIKRSFDINFAVYYLQNSLLTDNFESLLTILQCFKVGIPNYTKLIKCEPRIVNSTMGSSKKNLFD